MVLSEKLQLKVIICSKIDLTGEKASTIAKIQGGGKIMNLEAKHAREKHQNNIIVGILYNLFGNMEDMHDVF